ncbi:MAG: hypothetical protein ABSH29_25225 [Acidimicrobiales bacterium]|jgi:hypothetical protein
MATSVPGAFNQLLTNFKLTDTQADSVRTKISTISDFFETNFAMAEGPIAIGSYARNTIIRSERDVDLLAPLSYGKYKATYDNDPQGLLYMVRNKLNSRFSTTNVSSKRVAVKIDFSDVSVDVVPCFKREGDGYLMPNGSGGWMATNPAYHTRLMFDQNAAHEHYLKPVVKFMKFWNFANGSHLSSLHVELMTERIWRDANMGKLYSYAVAETLRCMPSWVKTNFADPWKDGAKIDSYLTRDERKVATRLLDQDATNAKNAEILRKEGRVEKAFAKWSVVYRNEFPAYG